MPYPASLTIEVWNGRRNRLTVFLRPIFAIPHAILVGPGFGSSPWGGAGVLGVPAYVMAVMSCFTLLINGEQPAGIREFALYYLR